MVALLEDRSIRSTPSAGAGRGPGSPRARQPAHLQVVPASAPVRSGPPSPVVLGVVAVMLVLALAALRLGQGLPPTTSWTELGEASAAAGDSVAGPGDEVVDVQSGETMWAIAQRLAPGRDPRPVVDALARVNGGTQLQAGQRLVVPARLLRATAP